MSKSLFERHAYGNDYEDANIMFGGESEDCVVLGCGVKQIVEKSQSDQIVDKYAGRIVILDRGSLDELESIGIFKISVFC